MEVYVILSLTVDRVLWLSEGLQKVADLIVVTTPVEDSCSPRGVDSAWAIFSQHRLQPLDVMISICTAGSFSFSR